jgi:hypothetical protein
MYALLIYKIVFFNHLSLLFLKKSSNKSLSIFNKQGKILVELIFSILLFVPEIQSQAMAGHYKICRIYS